MASKPEATPAGVFWGLLLVLGGLGALFFGWPGFWIGAFSAVAAGLNANKKAKLAAQETKSMGRNSAEPRYRVVDPKPASAATLAASNKPSFAAAPSVSSKPSFDSSAYEAVVVDALAFCVAYDGKIDEAEVHVAINQIERDGDIRDKGHALDAFQKKLESAVAERLRSKALFDLSAASFSHKISALPEGPLRERLAAALTLQAQAAGAEGRSEVQAFADKLKRSLVHAPAISNEDAAEAYLRNSGDQRALQAFRHMRSNPATFGNRFKQAASNSSVMKTALGVFTGMIAADLVMGAVRQHQLETALADFDKHLESIGGVDQLALPDPSVETPLLPESPPAMDSGSAPSEWDSSEQVALADQGELASDQQDDPVAEEDAVDASSDDSSAEPEDDSSHEDSSDSSDSSSSFDFDSDF